MRQPSSILDVVRMGNSAPTRAKRTKRAEQAWIVFPTGGETKAIEGEHFSGKTAGDAALKALKAIGYELKEK